MDLRIANFLKKKQAREAKAKAEAEAVKAAKQKGIDHIAKAQKVSRYFPLLLQPEDVRC